MKVKEIGLTGKCLCICICVLYIPHVVMLNGVECVAKKQRKSLENFNSVHYYFFLWVCHCHFPPPEQVNFSASELIVCF